jgi:F-type H+-transporting ATPase subunit b
MLRILSVFAVLSFAAPAFAGPGVEDQAAEGEHHLTGVVNWWSWDYGPSAKDPAHKDWPPPFGYAIVNFVIFLGLMSRILGKPLQQMVRDRHDRIRTDLDEARKLREGAQAMLAEYQKKVENVDAEVATLLDQIRKEAEAEKARIIAAAEDQAQRLKADAEKQIGAEIERARLELKRGVTEAAIAAAEQILQKQIGADDQRKMAERYVANLDQISKRAS